MTLNPHAPIFKPTTCSRLFTIYRPELLTEMDASTSQDIIVLTIPTKYPKTSPDTNSPIVSEQLHLLTSQVSQLKIKSEQTLEQTKPLIQTFHWLISSSSSTSTQFNIKWLNSSWIITLRRMNALSCAPLFADLKMS